MQIGQEYSKICGIMFRRTSIVLSKVRPYLQLFRF